MNAQEIKSQLKSLGINAQVRTKKKENYRRNYRSSGKRFMVSRWEWIEITIPPDQITCVVNAWDKLKELGYEVRVSGGKMHPDNLNPQTPQEWAEIWGVKVEVK